MSISKEVPEFKIERDVPYPPKGLRSLNPLNAATVAALEKLEVGDSFAVAQRLRNNVLACIREKMRRHFPLRRFSLLRMTDGDYRVWRVEDRAANNDASAPLGSEATP